MPTPSNAPIRFLAFCALPVSKADLARDASEFEESKLRAYAKGDRAHVLLNECLPDPATVKTGAADFKVKK